MSARASLCEYVPVCLLVLLSVCVDVGVCGCVSGCVCGCVCERVIRLHKGTSAGVISLLFKKVCIINFVPAYWSKQRVNFDYLSNSMLIVLSGGECQQR